MEIIVNKNVYIFNLIPRSVQLVARNRKSRTEVESPRSVQLVARNRQSRTEVEFSRSVQLVARKNTHKNHRTSFRTEVKSFVQQVARYARNRECPKGGESRSVHCSFVHQVVRYARNGKQRANFK